MGGGGWGGKGAWAPPDGADPNRARRGGGGPPGGGGGGGGKGARAQHDGAEPNRARAAIFKMLGDGRRERVQRAETMGADLLIYFGQKGSRRSSQTNAARPPTMQQWRRHRARTYDRPSSVAVSAPSMRHDPRSCRTVPVIIPMVTLLPLPLCPRKAHT